MTEKIKVSDYIVKRLQNLGITDVFGLPGDYNFNILDAVIKNEGTNWINCTNELNAAYAADGYARIKGYGAVVTTFGVGELSAINGIAGAYSENVPVIKITGVPKTSLIKEKALIHHNFSEPDYYAFEKIYANVTTASAFLTFENAKSEIDRVFDMFVKLKKPVYIALPVDVCDYLIDDTIPETIVKSNSDSLKAASDRIIELLNTSKNPLIITDYLMKRFRLQRELNAFVQKFNIKVTSMIMGKGLIEEDLSQFIGINYAQLGNEDFRQIYENADLMLCFGTLFSDLNTLGFIVKPDNRFKIELQANCATVEGRIYKDVWLNDLMDVLLNSDAIIKKPAPENVFKGYQGIETSIAPIKTDDIFPLVQNFLKENDTVVVETGIISASCANMKLKTSSNYICQTMWGSIGWATPAAFGAYMADRSKRLILLTGEGSHQLTIQELANFFKYDVNPVIFVLNNNGYTIERILSNDPDDEFNNITKWNYSKVLELFGDGLPSKYFKVTTSNELKEALSDIDTKDFDKMCYVEIFTDKMDIPKALAMVKECIKNAKSCL